MRDRREALLTTTEQTNHTKVNRRVSLARTPDGFSDSQRVFGVGGCWHVSSQICTVKKTMMV